MEKILLVHWNAEEAEERAQRLRGAGFEATPCSSQGGEGFRELRASPPDAVVVDLSRLPSHGREVAAFLRRQKATRHVPIAFVGGAPEKVARVRELLPDAVRECQNTMMYSGCVFFDLLIIMQNRPRSQRCGFGRCSGGIQSAHDAGSRFVSRCPLVWQGS